MHNIYMCVFTVVIITLLHYFPPGSCVLTSQWETKSWKRAGGPQLRCGRGLQLDGVDELVYPPTGSVSVSLGIVP